MFKPKIKGGLITIALSRGFSIIKELLKVYS